MTVALRFEELRIVAGNAERVVEFRGSVTPIVGPVGTGKTSLLELVRYALGGDGKLSAAVRDHVDHVVLRCRFESGTMSFARRIGANTLEVFEADGVFAETLACGRSKRHRHVGAFLLEATGIAPQTVSSRRRTENLSFTDVYRYCYLSQPEIDRSVVRHDDKILARRRRATFEWLFGLSDAETAAADKAVTDATTELADARLEEAAVRRFLEAAGEGSEAELQGELLVVERTAERSTSELAALRSDMREVTADESSRQQEAARMANEVRAVNEEALAIQTRLRDHARAVAQYNLQVEQLTRATAARRVLDAIEFARCPRCLQSVTHRVVPDGACVVCTQPDPPRRTISTFDAGDPSGQLGFGDEAISDERRRIEALRDEVVRLSEEDRDQLDQLLNRQRSLEVVMRERLSDLDRRTEGYISPRYEAISQLSAESAKAEARRDAIRSALTYWSRLRDLARRVAHLESLLEQRKAGAAAARQALESRREIVVELSREFDEQIQRLQPPWYTGASIDLKTYLPDLNGAPFESLSGGEKTMVNVAYHLALLTVALRHREVRLPALLVIDTPRKNLGAGYDQTYAERIYRRIETLTDAFGGRFQLIIADNDPPSVALSSSQQIDLSYDDPLVPGVQHPGPEVEPVVPET